MLNEAVGVKLKNFGPIILLYYFSISELDTFLTLISKFTELTFSITEMLYNTFFTFILFPFFWFLFTFYNSTVRFRENA